LLWAAQPGELQAGKRILAGQVAYATRHVEGLPVEEVKAWIETAWKDPKKLETLVEDMEHVIEVLGSLGVG